MKMILSILFLLLVVLVVVLAASGLVVLAAYGLAWLLDLLLPFSLFETTVLSLAAIGLVGLAAVRFLAAPSPLSIPNDDDDDDWDDDDDDLEDWEDDVDEDDTPPVSTGHPGIPRWRQAIKPVDFSNARPDDRCPCGSGRKYKNCHGARSSSKG